MDFFSIQINSCNTWISSYSYKKGHLLMYNDQMHHTCMQTAHGYTFFKNKAAN